MTRRPKAASAVLGGLAVPLAAVLMAACSSSGSASKSTDVTVLFPKAVTMVRAADTPTYAKAVMYEADGTTQGGKTTTSAAGIVNWKFVLNNQDSKSRFRTAMLSYTPSGFGKVQGNPSPYLEDLPIKNAPTMTLDQAVSDLRSAGYKQAFATATLRNPLGPTSSNPLYIFGLSNNKYVGVDTVTKKVRPLSSSPGG